MGEEGPAGLLQRAVLAMALPGLDLAGARLDREEQAAAALTDSAAGGSGVNPGPAEKNEEIIAREAAQDLEEDYTLWEDPYAEKWPEFSRDDVLLIPGGEPKILIYHTHASEDYIDDKDGKVGGVLSAGRAMTQTLEGTYGIKTSHSEVVNDRPDYTRSYINSQYLLKQYVEKYNSLVTVIDLHRDAGMKSRSDTLVTIGGKECARLLLVMGDAYEGHEKNKAFADKIYAKTQEMYPGLMKPVRVANDRRYNQHLHPRAILLEVGSNLNTAEDARNSAAMFAEVLNLVLKEEGLLD
ncbi:MAG: stage II sporulation protein P [Peptococcaceae bacterium]|nr:stage II sporulation protein P [Peptococcaceae bacterium]